MTLAARSNPPRSASPIPTNPSAGITSNIPGRQGVPSILVDGGFSIGNNNEGELPQVGNTFQWTDNYTRHIRRAHHEIRRRRSPPALRSIPYFNINGFYTFLSDSNLCAPSNPNLPPPLNSSTGMNCDTPTTNDVGFADSYPDYFLGTTSSYTQGAAQAQDDRNTSLYLFAQDSWKIRPNLTLNYGSAMGTQHAVPGHRQSPANFPPRPGHHAVSLLDVPGKRGRNWTCAAEPAAREAAMIRFFPSVWCSPAIKACRAASPARITNPSPRASVWPGVLRPPAAGWRNLPAAPAKSSIRAGYGIFYNPIEQLVMEQFSAEPPFGGSTSLSNDLFNLPFEAQSGGNFPNPYGGVLHQTPKTPCASDTPAARRVALIGRNSARSCSLANFSRT